MGLGPIGATKKALSRAGLLIKDIDIVELNEAFASQSLACIRDLDIEEKKVKNTGGTDTIVGADTICVHSDTPNAIEIITKLNKAIKNN